MTSHQKVMILLIIGCIAIWQLLLSFDVVSPGLMPTPMSIVESLYKLLFHGGVLVDLFWTLARAGTGLFLALVLAIPIGLAIGTNLRLYGSISPIIDFFRSIPVTTIYPLFVLSLGIGHASKIGMVFWAAFFVLVFYSAQGPLLSGVARKEVLLLIGASNIQLFKFVTWPESIPYIRIGLRLAVSYALIVEVLCEMFMGSTSGIGQRIIDSYYVYAMDDLFALVVLMGVTGYIVNKLLNQKNSVSPNV